MGQLADGGRTIVSFHGRPIGAVPGPHLYSTVLDGSEVILFARPDGARLRLHRPIPDGIQLERMRPDTEAMLSSVLEMELSMLSKLRTKKSKIAGVLAVGCAARYRAIKEGQIQFDLPHALTKRKDRFPHATVVGCFMDGEIGTNERNLSTFSNWSMAEVFFADEPLLQADMYLSFKALEKHLRGALTTSSVKDAMQSVLELIEHACYEDGAMISLKFLDGEKAVIVGQAAAGGKWGTVVLGRTRHEYPGQEGKDKDILAIVLATRKPEIVWDAQSDNRCDNQTAMLGGVRSFMRCRCCPTTADHSAFCRSTSRTSDRPTRGSRGKKRCACLRSG